MLNWEKINEVYVKKRTEKTNVEKKIDLLKDLTLDLSDAGLKVDIWNGSKYFYSPDGVYRSWYDAKDHIMLRIEDDQKLLGEYTKFDKLIDEYDIIQKFEKQVSSYGMKFSKKYCEKNIVYYYFSKQGSKTKSDLIYQKTSSLE